MKRLQLVMYILMLLCLSTALSAQTATPAAAAAPGGALPPVAVMPMSEDGVDRQNQQEMTKQFYTAVLREVKNTANYEPQPKDLPPGPEPPSDLPPPNSVVDDLKYALTGQLFPDEEENHFQLWLWDMKTPRLIYTDELVCEEFADGEELLPAMIAWIFSQIPKEEPITVAVAAVPVTVDVTGTVTAVDAAPAAGAPVETEISDEDAWKLQKFRYGIRLAATSQYYITPQGFEVGLHVSYQLMPALTLQLEAVYARESLPFEGYELMGGGSNLALYTSTYTSSYLMVPLLIKFTYRPPGRIVISPYAGAFYIQPLGNAAYSSSSKTMAASGTLKQSLNSPLGYTAGVSVGAFWDPGILVFDIRYNANLGETSIEEPTGNRRFTRGMMSFGVGYELGL